MDKQKQIEEMARILCPCSKSSCDSCIQNGVECIDYREARAFYNAGYRKIPEGGVVLTREEYEKLQNNQIPLHPIVLTEKQYTDLKLEAVYARIETAEKFANRVKMAFYYEFDELIPSIMADKIDEICKEITEGKG